MKTQTKVLLVDDLEVIRQGLRRILESEDMYIVGDFANAEEAFARMAELSPERPSPEWPNSARTSCSWTPGCQE